MTIYNSASLVEGTIQYMQALKLLILKSSNRQAIASFLEENKYKKKSGITTSVENDVFGFYRLKNTDCLSLIPIGKYKNSTREEIKLRLLERISAFKEGDFELPPPRCSFPS